MFGEGDGTNIDTSQFDEAPLELTKKKKKKKDKVLDLDLGDDGIDELGDEIGDLKLEKKKKKKKNVDFKDETEVRYKLYHISYDSIIIVIYSIHDSKCNHYVFHRKVKRLQPKNLAQMIKDPGSSVIWVLKTHIYMKNL